MNGLDLSDRIDRLTARLEKFSKLALARTLATDTLSHAAFRSTDPITACEQEAADIEKEVAKWHELVQWEYDRRRFDRRMRELQNPGERRKKRRKKKRRAKRGV